MRKVYFISYTNIRNGKTVAPYFSAFLDAAKRLPDNYQFYFATCDCESSNIHAAPKILSTLNKIFMIITARIHVPFFIRRTISESLFDYYYSWVLRKEKGEYNLITAMYSPISTKVASRAGARIAYIAANHDDNLYYRVEKEEKAKYNYHFTDVYDSDFRNRYYNRMLNNITDVASSAKLVCDLFPKHFNKAIFATPTRRLDYIPKSDYKNDIESFVIGYIGHTVLLKGVHILAKAITNSKMKSNVVLRVCGKIDGNVKNIIDNTGIKIEYLGFIKENEKNAFYNSCDLMVTPSIYDAGPTTVLEAMESAVPMIISSGCGFIEYLEAYKKECIFETRNIEDLTEKLEYAFSNYSRLVEIAKSLRSSLDNNHFDNRISVCDYIKNFT